jgi:hypothetical protein
MPPSPVFSKKAFFREGISSSRVHTPRRAALHEAPVQRPRAGVFT